jgi:hypothetical protein
MNRPGEALPATVRTTELQAVLEPMLGRLARLEHRPAACCTSSALEEIDVVLEDGRSLALLLKDLSRQALLESARRVKPAFLYNPLREIEVYRNILSGSPSPLRGGDREEGLPSPPLGTALFHGAVIDHDADRFWIFLESVSGRELYRVGEFSLWLGVARWLALFHRRFAAGIEGLVGAAPLLKYDGDYYRLWMQRAQAFLPARSPLRSDFARLAERYDRVIERLLALPTTFLHGEFYASNVLVQETAAGLRVCPVDWEMAAIGPGLMDLAALSAGGWTEAERNDLALAYWAEWAGQQTDAPDTADFLSALDHCRLHLAVQWLGWAADWVPPPEQRQDWLGEALRLAERIGL